MVELSPLRQLRMGQLPKMVSWYDPRLLARIGVRTIVSSVFGQYADQRLMQAVTDPAEDKDLVARYDYRDPNAGDPHKCVACDETGAFWIDYIADVGDGFECHATRWPTCWRRTASTCAAPAACATARSSSWAATSATRRPRARNTRSGCCSPSTGPSRSPNPDRKLFAIPGNHDWYDGLNAFDGLFCSSRDKLSNAGGNVIGGWQCQQHRSYWALRLPYNWWIWGADIQFSKYLDTSQVNYFERVAEQMGPQDNLIICLAEPSWMLADLQGEDNEENFFKITTIARKRGARVVRRHRRRLAQLQPLLRPRARRPLHHVGRRRRLPASHARAPERHLGALARAPGRGGEATRRDSDRRAPRRGLEGQGLQHPPQAQHQGGRGRRRAGRAGRAGRHRAAAARGPRPAQARADQAAGAQVLSRARAAATS